jgi:hypothetical protein
MDEERTRIEKVLREHRRRLCYLELEKARKGISTDPSVLIEIDDLNAEITKLNTQLSTLGAQQTSVPSAIGMPPPLSSPPRPTRPEPAQITLRFEATKTGAKIS